MGEFWYGIYLYFFWVNIYLIYFLSDKLFYF